jgi:hypothetical protein
MLEIIFRGLGFCTGYRLGALLTGSAGCPSMYSSTRLERLYLIEAASSQHLLQSIVMP